MERAPLFDARAKGRQKAEQGQRGTLGKTLGQWSTHSEHKIKGEEFEAGDVVKVPTGRTNPKHV